MLDQYFPPPSHPTDPDYLTQQPTIKTLVREKVAPKLTNANIIALAQTCKDMDFCVKPELDYRKCLKEGGQKLVNSLVETIPDLPRGIRDLFPEIYGDIFDSTEDYDGSLQENDIYLASGTAWDPLIYTFLDSEQSSAPSATSVEAYFNGENGFWARFKPNHSWSPEQIGGFRDYINKTFIPAATASRQKQEKDFAALFEACGKVKAESSSNR